MISAVGVDFYSSIGERPYLSREKGRRGTGSSGVPGN
jgi:hypothetical protein